MSYESYDVDLDVDLDINGYPSKLGQTVILCQSDQMAGSHQIAHKTLNIVPFSVKKRVRSDRFQRSDRLF